MKSHIQSTDKIIIELHRRKRRVTGSMKRINAAEIKAGHKIESTFMIRSKRLVSFRERPGYFLTLVLGDRTGQVDAVLWEGAEEFNRQCRKGDIVAISGEVREYGGTLQINLNTISICREDDFAAADFLPVTPRDRSEMYNSLKELAKKVNNVHLRNLLWEFFNDRVWEENFKSAPAAKLHHQAYLGGLLEHTLNVAMAADRLADLYPRLDRDLMITGAILHDVGKVEEYTFRKNIDFTDEGRLLGHILLGIQMVNSRIEKLPDFPRELRLKILHIIASHHGRYEWQSPKRPKFAEAAAIHHLDLLDTTLDMFFSATGKKSTDDSHWTDWVKSLERHIFTG